MIDKKPPFFSLIADLDYALELTRLHEKVPCQFYEEPKNDDSPYSEMLLNFSREKKSYDLPRFDNKDFPDMKMVIQDPNFDCDFIYKGRLYFSKQVREKFSEEYLNAQYLPIDDRKSCPEIRAKEYMMVNFRSVRAAIKPDSSIYEFQKKLDEGTATGPDYYKSYETNWIENYVADTPIFKLAGIVTSLVVTKEFAKQVFDYGFKGFNFIHVYGEKSKLPPYGDPSFNIDDYDVTRDDLI